jgi:hypothetical protein
LFKIGLERDAALLVVAAQPRGPWPKLTSATALSGTVAAAGGAHRQVLDGRKIGARRLDQADANRYLAVGQRELGVVLRQIAQRCHAHGVADVGHGYAELRRPRPGAGAPAVPVATYRH